MSLASFAQLTLEDNQKVNVSAVGKYQVVKQTGHSYTWSVIMASDNSDAPASAFTVTKGTQTGFSTVDIKWNTDGKYKVIVTDVVDLTTCTSVKMSVFEVEVVKNAVVLKWDDTQWNKVNEICADVASREIKFSLENANFPAKAKVSFENEDGVDLGAALGELTSDKNGLFTLTLPLVAVDLGDGEFKSKFIITEIKDHYGVIPTDFDAKKEREMTIHRNPKTSPIKHD